MWQHLAALTLEPGGRENALKNRENSKSELPRKGRGRAGEGPPSHLMRSATRLPAGARPIDGAASAARGLRGGGASGARRGLGAERAPPTWPTATLCVEREARARPPRAEELGGLRRARRAADGGTTR